MNKDLINYIEISIFPIYEKNDRAHRLWHITGVIERSLCIAKDYDVNIDMVYAIAAFHDIGNYIDRNNHEVESARIFVEDKNMGKFFNKIQLKIIKEAIEDHRASLIHEPRSVYGKIIATADKFITTDDILKSVHLHTLENFPGLEWKKAIDKDYQYLNKKYGENGYAKIQLPFPSYDKFLIEVRDLLKDKDRFSAELRRINTKIKEEFKDLS